MRFIESVKRAFGGGIEQKSIPLSDPAIAEIFGAAPTISGAVVNSTTALHVPAVLQAVRLISETVGSLPCKLYRHEGDSKEAAKDHPAYRLAHRFAVGWQSAGKLRVDLTADALLHGAGFAEVVRVGEGRPVELHRLAPDTVQRRTEDDGEPYYLVNVKGQRQRRLSYRDVLHVPGWRDVSPVAFGKEAIGHTMTLSRYGSQFFASKAMMKPMLRMKPGSDEKQTATRLANIARSFKRANEDPSMPVLLTTEVDDSNLTMTSTDAQFIENRVEQINEIARIFGVPPSMLYQLDRATWSNAEQMAASFLQLCLRPWLDRWQDAYATVLLTEDEQDDLYFEFVIDDLLRADAAGRTTNIAALITNRVIAPNEARAMLNMPRHDDPSADELANPYTTTTTTGPALREPPKEPA
mgnify:CR=1 FL=1